MARTTPRGETGRAGSWPLHGFWRTWYWISAAIALVLAVAGVAVVPLGLLFAPWPVGALALLPAVILLPVAGVVGWQVSATALGVSLSPDGAVVVARLGRPLHTDVAGVRRIRLSVLVSSHTPAVIETDRGSAYLLHPTAEVDEIVAALRHANPRIVDAR